MPHVRERSGSDQLQWIPILFYFIFPVASVRGRGGPEPLRWISFGTTASQRGVGHTGETGQRGGGGAGWRGALVELMVFAHAERDYFNGVFLLLDFAIFNFFLIFFFVWS